MTILDDAKLLAQTIAQLAFTVQTLIKVARSVQAAVDKAPTTEQAQVLADAERLLGEAAVAVSRAGIVLSGLEVKQ